MLTGIAKFWKQVCQICAMEPIYYRLAEGIAIDLFKTAKSSQGS